MSSLRPFADIRKEASKACFAEIYKLTLQLCSLTAATAPCSRGHKKCWVDIVPIWKNHASALGCSNVFYAALYHIHWREFPPEITNPVLKHLLLLVESELLNDGYSFDAWRLCPEFREAFDLILDTVRLANHRFNTCKWHSDTFRRYLYSYTYSKVIYKNSVPREMWTYMTPQEIRSFTTAAELYEYHHIFEQTIGCLLPESVSWSTEWANENFIMQRLLALYGVDFTKDYADFDRLINAVGLILNNQNYLSSLLCVNNFTFPMAQAIWGTDALKQVEQIFSKVCSQHSAWAKRPRVRAGHSVYSHTNVINSWLYALIDGWRISKDTRLTPKMRAKLMKISMGI